ncbi:hypothetical protein GCM10011416_08060 [Polaribacter pacificus]|uniref:HTH LytTR-type domain-containing protein n=1 Tax=Polaribacter pacificus TaxID=1775173 RepID=A0A917HVR9_9FLAO|nr:hypothetical protein GCM10011416_08060 [Polaribacter pacificus]
MGFGFITFTALFLTHFIGPLLFKTYFNEDNWVIWKQIVFGLVSVFLIALGNGIYRSYFFGEYEGYFLETISNCINQTVAVGFFPVIIFVFIDEKFARKKRLKKAVKISKEIKKLTPSIKTPELIKIYSENEKDFLEIVLSNLVYITSQKNYVSFFIYDKRTKELKEKVLRVSLKKVENSLSSYEKFIKCHRSYIVNTNYMDALKGNARNYYLETEVVDFDIPVSRNFPVDHLKKLIS